MSIALYRVDDRLVHGQVVIGWGQPMGVRFIVLVDDEVAASPWEQDLYRMAVPSDMDLLFATRAEAAAQLPRWQADLRRGILLTGDIDTMAAVAGGEAAVPRINLGGLHHRPGRRERLPYIYLTDDELGRLKTLAGTGVEISAQDLPTSAPVALRALA